MKLFLLFLLLLLVTQVISKCGLYKHHDKSKETKDKHWLFRGGSVRAAAGRGYGYESMSTTVSCNDMEMFEQCKRAQQISGE